MKANIKTYVLSSVLLVAFVVSTNAQTRKRTTTTTRTTTTIAKSVPNRVSSRRVEYKTPKKKVVSVRSVPNKTVIRHQGQSYYYSNNKFYTSSRGRYIVIAPKIGFRIKTLPSNYSRVRFNNQVYYNVSGTFYTLNNTEYEVVEPEIGTLVYELPDGHEKVTIDGQTYYEYANILYEKVQVQGTRAYEVVGIVEME
ncbi:hypothetical protein D9O36_09900 [Zobellia amurskyensis]|uniref:Uncharacterized protein n=1 Tax=Zobellia amurskyensis TaxID=248905 RepID=A0A7X3D209_9FLAO|nr:DUF6515 family protein [Zobellia amurskyensis]MUH36155.1 hypothetical protein [Zobellia amurskyensis]